MQLWTAAAWAALVVLTLSYFLLPRRVKVEPKPGEWCCHTAVVGAAGQYLLLYSQACKALVCAVSAESWAHGQHCER